MRPLALKIVSFALYRDEISCSEHRFVPFLNVNFAKCYDAVLKLSLVECNSICHASKSAFSATPVIDARTLHVYKRSASFRATQCIIVRSLTLSKNSNASQCEARAGASSWIGVRRAPLNLDCSMWANVLTWSGTFSLLCLGLPYTEWRQGFVLLRKIELESVAVCAIRESLPFNRVVHTSWKLIVLSSIYALIVLRETVLLSATPQAVCCVDRKNYVWPSGAVLYQKTAEWQGSGTVAVSDHCVLYYK